jgi:hypothetical protein
MLLEIYVPVALVLVYLGFWLTFKRSKKLADWEIEDVI